MLGIHRSQGSRHLDGAGADDRHEVIDLTLSPSPPGSPRRAPSAQPIRRQRSSLRRIDSPYARQGRDSPAGHNLEVIDLDAIPDHPQPAQRDALRDRERPILPDYGFAFAQARIRQQSGTPGRFDHIQHDNPPQRIGHQGWSQDPSRRVHGFANIYLGVGGFLSNYLTFGLPNFAAVWANRNPPPVAPHRHSPPVPFGDNHLHGALGLPPPLTLNQIAEIMQRNDEPQIVGQNHPEDKPIKTAREGFTRSPTSNDAIGCSKCDQELGDSDDDLQKQIWVMKCGHVRKPGLLAGSNNSSMVY